MNRILSQRFTIAQGAKDNYSIWAFLGMFTRYGYFDKIDVILAGDPCRKKRCAGRYRGTRQHFAYLDDFLLSPSAGAKRHAPDLGANIAPVNEIHNALGVTWEVADPAWYRKVLIKMTWDDQAHPSVLVPLGDFFCIGHSMPGNFASLPFTVSVKPEEQFKFGGVASVNCYLPMPFNKRAKIEIINENDVPFGLYFHIDYELYRQPLDAGTAYFHAQWRREYPCDGWGANIHAFETTRPVGREPDCPPYELITEIVIAT